MLILTAGTSQTQPDYIALAMVLALFVVVAVMALRKRFAKPAAGSPVPVPAADTAPAKIPAAPAAAPAVTGTGEAVTAPMPGNILKVNVTAGQACKRRRCALHSGSHEDGKRDHGSQERHRHPGSDRQGFYCGYRRAPDRHRLMRKTL